VARPGFAEVLRRMWRGPGYRSREARLLSAFAATSEGHRSGMYELTAATDGVLHAGFLRQFEDMWHEAKLVSGEAGA
jgi:hypothetical protein